MADEPLQTENLKDVEVFAAGEWNGYGFSDADIDALVSNTNAVIDEVKPFVKISHDDDQWMLRNAQLPAGGWLENIRKVGEKIVCDIRDVPKALADVISAGGFKRVSAEVWWDFKSAAGDVYQTVLTAVAFLGGELPAVTSLADLPKLYNTNHAPLRMVFTRERSTQGDEPVAEEHTPPTPPEPTPPADPPKQEPTPTEPKDDGLKAEFAALKDQMAGFAATIEAQKATIDDQKTKIEQMQQRETAREAAKTDILITEFAAGLKSGGHLLPKEEQPLIDALKAIKGVPQKLTFKAEDGTETQKSVLEHVMGTVGPILKARTAVPFGEFAASPQDGDEATLRAEARAELKAMGVAVKEEPSNG